MVNKTMQAKEMKLRRQKRLFPKQYAADYIPTGKPPDRMVVNEYKQRAKGLAFDAKYLEYLEQRARFKGVPAGKFEVNQKLMEILTAAEKLNFVKLMQTPLFHTLMFYPSDKRFFMIYEENFKEQKVYCSMRYQFKANMIADWQANKIRWVSVSPLCQHPTD